MTSRPTSANAGSAPVPKGVIAIGTGLKVPSVTSMRSSALEDLKLEKITVITPGNVDFLIHENVRVLGLKNYVLKNDNK